MTTALSVTGLCKTYPAFQLKDVALTVEPGRIVGFVGRNGAGKTTTIKSILGLVHPDAGDIRFFDLPFRGSEAEIRQRVGYAGSGASCYPRKKLGQLMDVTRRFYDTWDDALYRKYAKMFSLDPEKTPRELSAGMQVKAELALALSHGAELLLLDEPTSGLDPASREEILEILLTLSREGTAILFSTHIVSDLEKSADSVVFIRNGQIAAADALEAFKAAWLLAHAPGELSGAQKAASQGERLARNGRTVLLRREASGAFAGLELTVPTLDEIIVHLEKEAE